MSDTAPAGANKPATGTGAAAPTVPPRLLLVTDADLSPGSRGAGRTLVNLFSRYPAERLLAIGGSATHAGAMETGARVIAAAPQIPGRITKALRPRVGHVDAAWAAMRALPEREAIGRFAPELVLAVPTNAIGVALAEQCRRFAPMVTYLMDDWIAYEPGVPIAFDTRRRGRQLLIDSAAWLSISPYLLASTREFAGTERPAHVVHNPVPLSAPPEALRAPRAGRFRVAYAGSVWPMHWNAVSAVAQSVQRLRTAGTDIEMVVFTDRYFWGRYESEWQRLGVVDGGLVPYSQLSTALGDCDVLVVASSFEPSQAHMSRSSIQTKVTDYLAAGRPILACGPSDAASNRFLRERALALFAEDPAPASMDAALSACVAARADGPALARRGWDVVRAEHEMGVVTDRLYAFLAAVARHA